MGRRFVMLAAVVLAAVVGCSSDDATAPSTGDVASTSDADVDADTSAPATSTGDDAAAFGDESSSEQSPTAENDTSLPSVTVDDGSNDMAQDALDDIGADIDLDELEENLGELSTGEGGGTVTIDGVAWEYEAEICIAPDDQSFLVSGVGSDPEGTPAFIEVTLDVTSDFDGDGEPDESASVTVGVGRTELFADVPDDQPEYVSTVSVAAGALELREFEYEVDDGRFRGGGDMQDFNGVAVPFGETLPFSFDVGCA